MALTTTKQQQQHLYLHVPVHVLVTLLLIFNNNNYNHNNPVYRNQVSAFTPNTNYNFNKNNKKNLNKKSKKNYRNNFFSETQILPPLEAIDSLPVHYYYNTYRNDEEDLNDGEEDDVENQDITSTTTSLTLPYSSQNYNNNDYYYYYYNNNNDDDDNYFMNTIMGGESLPVLYTNDPKMVNQWLVEHIPMDCCAIGFDTESVPDAPWIIDSKFKGRPVTVQLATPKASIVIPLIKNNRYSKACLPLLEAVLSDGNIVKCGCSIDDDMIDLKRMVPGLKHLDVKSRLDLGLLGVSKNRLGLKTLTKALLHRNLEKPKRLAVSDWSRFPLSDEQLAYGARDAWASVAVLSELARKNPETFGTEALIETLHSQPSLRELLQNKNRRKKAKQLLTNVQTSYRKASAKMPSDVQEKVSNLRAVLKETQMDPSYIVESLGTIPDEARVVLELIEDRNA